MGMSDELVPFKRSQGRGVGIQCSATSKQTGNRCRRFTGHPGLSVCRFHGGASPVVRAAADRRVAALVPLAIQAIKEILEDPNSSKRLAAARSIVRLAGIDARTVWEDSDVKLAIEAGGSGKSADEQIEELLASFRDTHEPENAGQESDITDPPPPPPGA
jgi:hypothetical protein